MSVQDLPPLKAVKIDSGAVSYLVKPEGSEGMGLRVTINPDGSSIYSPLDPQLQGFSLDSEASKLLYDVLRYHNEHNTESFHLAVLGTS